MSKNRSVTPINPELGSRQPQKKTEPIPMNLRITRNQHALVHQTIQEFLQLRGMLQAKELEAKRLTDMIEKDAGIDPDLYLIEGVSEERGLFYLKLVPAPPRPNPSAGKLSEPAPAAAPGPTPEQ